MRRGSSVACDAFNFIEWQRFGAKTALADMAAKGIQKIGLLLCFDTFRRCRPANTREAGVARRPHIPA